MQQLQLALVEDWIVKRTSQGGLLGPLGREILRCPKFRVSYSSWQPPASRTWPSSPLQKLKNDTRWWQLKYFWNFHPENWGNDLIGRAYFSDGLVQPPPKMICWWKMAGSVNARRAFAGLFCIFFWYFGVAKDWQKERRNSCDRNGTNDEDSYEKRARGLLALALMACQGSVAEVWSWTFGGEFVVDGFSSFSLLGILEEMRQFFLYSFIDLNLGEFLKLISICSISIPVQLKVLGYDWVLTSLFRWYLSHNDGTERNRRNHEPLQACCDLMMQVLQLGEGGDLWFFEEVFCSTNGYLPEVWQLAPEKLLGPNRKVVFLSHHFSGVYVKLRGCSWWFGGLDPLMKGSVT